MGYVYEQWKAEHGFGAPEMFMKQKPEISMYKIPERQRIVFVVMDEEKMVSEYEFQKMVRDLKIKSKDECLSRFDEVCDWFIKNEQYTQFEEVKNEC